MVWSECWHQDQGALGACPTQPTRIDVDFDSSRESSWSGEQKRHRACNVLGNVMGLAARTDGPSCMNTTDDTLNLGLRRRRRPTASTWSPPPTAFSRSRSRSTASGSIPPISPVLLEVVGIVDQGPLDGVDVRPVEGVDHYWTLGSLCEQVHPSTRRSPSTAPSW